MKKGYMAPAFASLFLAAASLALTAAGASAQQGPSMPLPGAGFSPLGQEYALGLAPQAGGGQLGQEYVLVLAPQAAGQLGQEYVLVLRPRATGQIGQYGQQAPFDMGHITRESFERGYQMGRLYGPQPQQPDVVQVLGALQDAERAVQQDDQEAAKKAIQRAREVVAHEQQFQLGSGQELEMPSGSPQE